MLSPYPTPSRPRSSLPLGLCLLLAAWMVACTGRTTTTTPEPAPATPAKAAAETAAGDDLPERLERLNERLEEARVKFHIPGMAVAVVKDDAVIFSQGLGHADLEQKRPATPRTMFAVGSTTKAFTSALVGMQVDAGKLAWDRPVAEVLPEFTLAPRPLEGKPSIPTLRDVLCHRTGFTRMGLMWAGSDLSHTEVLAMAGKAEPWAGFRERFLYNNVTYAAAGEAAARTAGMTWPELLEQRLLDPLGMSHTNVTVAAAMTDPARAQGYRWREVHAEHEALPMRALDSIAPAGAINSNVEDMSRWLRLQLGRGEFEGQRLIEAETLEQTWTPLIKVGGEVQYGMGWMVSTWEGHRLVEHGGNIDGYTAEVAMLPDDGLAFVMLTNISTTPLQRGVIDIVFDSLLGEPPAKADGDTVDLRPYLGRYVADFGAFSDARFAVTAEDGRLYVDVPGQTNYELKAPDKEGRWPFALTDTIAVSFERDDQGSVQVMRLHQGGFDFELPREGYTPAPDWSRAEVLDKLGRYRTANGKLEANVMFQGGRLAADVKGQMVFELHKPDADGKWRLRIRKDIAVSFRPGAKAGAPAEALILYQDGSETELLRVEDKRSPLPTVDELLRRNKAAAWSRRVAKLGLVELKGKIRMPQSAVEGTFRIVFDSERRYRVEVDFGRHGTTLEVYDGREAWSDSSFGPRTDHRGKYLAQARIGTPFALLGDWRELFDKVAVEGRESRDGVEYVVVSLQAGELPAAKALVDPRTGTIHFVQQPVLNEGQGPIRMGLEFDGYRRAAGLRLPHRMRSSNVHSGATIFEVETVRKAKGDPAVLFGRPPGA